MARTIVYIILIGMVATMGLMGLATDSKGLVWLSAAGIIYLLFYLIWKRER